MSLVYWTSCTSKTCPPLHNHPPISAASAYSSSSYIPCPSLSLPCLSQTAFSQSYFLHLSSCYSPAIKVLNCLSTQEFLYLSLSFWNIPLVDSKPCTQSSNTFSTLSLPVYTPTTTPLSHTILSISRNLFHYSRPILLHTTLCPLGPPSSHLIQLPVIWTHINLWSDGKSMPSPSSTLICRWNIPDIRPSLIAECAVLLIRSQHFSSIVTYIWLHP